MILARMYYEFKKAPNIVKMLGSPHDVVTSQGPRRALPPLGRPRRRKVTANQIIAYYEGNSDVPNLPDIPNITKFQSVLEFHIIFQLI